MLFSAQILRFFDILYPTLSNEAKYFADWFKTNYIARPNGSAAKFKPSYWSVYSLTLLGYAEHQNYAEAEHHRLNGIVGIHHPGFYKLVREISMEIATVSANIKRHLTGQPLPPQLKKTVKKCDRIKLLMETRNKRTPMEYLEGISASLNVEP